MDTEKATAILHGYCRCGCGEKTTVSPSTVRRNGWVKGEPRRFVNGHQNRGALHRNRNDATALLRSEWEAAGVAYGLCMCG